MRPATPDEASHFAGGSSGIYLGHYLNPDNTWLPKPLIYSGERHGLVFGPTGVGKTSRWLASVLLRENLASTSVVVNDPKAELAAVCARYRHEKLKQNVKIIDPFHKLKEIVASDRETYDYLFRHKIVETVGFDPLATLDSGSPYFYDNAAAIGEALIRIEGSDPHWPEAAQGLITGLCMWEVARDRKPDEGPPSLAHVRAMLTAPVRMEGSVPVSGLPLTVAAVIAAQQDAIKDDRKGAEYRSLDVILSLIGRFIRPTRETDSVVATADTQSRWLLSRLIQRNLDTRPSFDFASLKTADRPTTLFVILPAERVRSHSAWIRAVIVCCMRALYTRGGRRTVFLLDEMPALGPLPPLTDAFAIVRGFNLQIFCIAQDLVQLKDLYRDRFESFLANAGVIQFFTPNDMTTAEYISRRAGITTRHVRNVGSSLTPDGTPTSQEGWSQQGKPLLEPAELTGLTAGSGLLFLSGLSEAVPCYVPLYREISFTAERAQPNPYYAP